MYTPRVLYQRGLILSRYTRRFQFRGCFCLTIVEYPDIKFLGRFWSRVNREYSEPRLAAGRRALRAPVTIYGKRQNLPLIAERGLDWIAKAAHSFAAVAAGHLGARRTKTVSLIFAGNLVYSRKIAQVGRIEVARGLKNQTSRQREIASAIADGITPHNYRLSV